MGPALSCHHVQYQEIVPYGVQESGSGTNELGTGVSRVRDVPKARRQKAKIRRLILLQVVFFE